METCLLAAPNQRKHMEKPNCIEETNKVVDESEELGKVSNCLKKIGTGRGAHQFQKQSSLMLQLQMRKWFTTKQLTADVQYIM